MGLSVRIDDHVGLRAIAHALDSILPSRSTLTVKRCGLRTSPIGSPIFGSPVVGIDRALRYAPSHALNLAGENSPGKHVEHHLDWRVRLDVLQAVLAEIGVDPDVAGIDESQRRLADGDELTEGQLQIGDHAVGRGRDRGANEIELGLLDRGERFAKLRIVRRPEARALAWRVRARPRPRERRPRPTSICAVAWSARALA